MKHETAASLYFNRSARISRLHFNRFRTALIRHALFSGHARSHSNPGKVSLRILSEHDIGPGIDRTFTRFLALAYKSKGAAKRHTKLNARLRYPPATGRKSS